jgi:hypothetical protein
MKKIHYKNIGLPKTGTTWLWEQLAINPDIDMFHLLQRFKSIKKMHNSHPKIMYKGVLKELTFSSKEEYMDVYSKYDVSVNFDTWFYKFISTDSSTWENQIIKKSSHISVSLRNPYELLDSWYNFFEAKYSDRETFKSLDRHEGFYYLTTYKTMFDALALCKDKVKILFYDDIKNDHEKYLREVCDFIGISYSYDPLIGNQIIGPTIYNNNNRLTIDDEKLIMHINENICRIEDFTQRDLTHWKKNT